MVGSIPFTPTSVGMAWPRRPRARDDARPGGNSGPTPIRGDVDASRMRQGGRSGCRHSRGDGGAARVTPCPRAAESARMRGCGGGVPRSGEQLGCWPVRVSPCPRASARMCGPIAARLSRSLASLPVRSYAGMAAEAGRRHSTLKFSTRLLCVQYKPMQATPTVATSRAAEILFENARLHFVGCKYPQALNVLPTGCGAGFAEYQE